MADPFKLVMLSAWHEQGGNVLQRFFDSHPQCYTYPFESQIGTPLSRNLLAGPDHVVPLRYAYPEFPLGLPTYEDAYNLFWDEELKTYLRARERSKFRHCGLVMDENLRESHFEAVLGSQVMARKLGECAGYARPTRADYVEAYFRSTFDAWTNFARTGKETHYVGYSPPILLDADKLFADFPAAHMVHIVRNPWSGYADTKKRPFPMSLARYCQIWSVVQLAAATLERKHPSRFKVVRFEDLVQNPRKVLDSVAAFVGLDPFPASPLQPTFNRAPMPGGTVYPWGTIKHATPAANLATARELTQEESLAVARECGEMVDRWYAWYWGDGDHGCGAFANLG